MTSYVHLPAVLRSFCMDIVFSAYSQFYMHSLYSIITLGTTTLLNGRYVLHLPPSQHNSTLLAYYSFCMQDCVDSVKYETLLTFHLMSIYMHKPYYIILCIRTLLNGLIGIYVALTPFYTVTPLTFSTFKHAIRPKNRSEWNGPLYPQFGRLGARMQSFST